MSNAPLSHRQEAEKLQSEGRFDLFEAQLKPSGVIYFTPNYPCTWQGNTYESLACDMNGIKRTADETSARPQFRFQNPYAVFSSAVADGALDGATLIRRRVLVSDIEANNNVSDVQVWIVTRITQMTRDFIEVELRAPSDGPFFVVPARIFAPPDFPSVSL